MLSTGPNVSRGCGAVDLEMLLILAVSTLWYCQCLLSPTAGLRHLFPAPLELQPWLSLQFTVCFSSTSLRCFCVLTADCFLLAVPSG